jgi:hypothetical protein
MQAEDVDLGRKKDLTLFRSNTNQSEIWEDRRSNHRMIWVNNEVIFSSAIFLYSTHFLNVNLRFKYIIELYNIYGSFFLNIFSDLLL